MESGVYQVRVYVGQAWAHARGGAVSTKQESFVVAGRRGKAQEAFYNSPATVSPLLSSHLWAGGLRGRKHGPHPSQKERPRPPLIPDKGMKKERPSPRPLKYVGTFKGSGPPSLSSLIPAGSSRRGRKLERNRKEDVGFVSLILHASKQLPFRKLLNEQILCQA